MAAFNGTGFAAVDAFFGKEATSPATTTTETAAHEHQQHQQQGPKRLGVGATRDDAKNALSASNPLTKRLLQVGMKRKLAQEADDAHVDDADAGVDDTVPVDREEDGEEDGGRTAISERTAVTVPLAVAVATANAAETAGKKKKKGKKERQKATEEAAQAQALLSTAAQAAAEGSASEQPTEVTAQAETAANQEPPSKKSKRRKIRSRQKNIYKDNRKEKPSHLVPGQRHYQGRPLTTETRQKLNLPEPVGKQKDDSWTSSWVSDQNQQQQQQPEHEDAVDAMPLAVDAAENNIAVDETVKKPKKKRSKSSSKYKNLN
jgi:hypothetical protein